jgi:hypothetical protein
MSFMSHIFSYCKMETIKKWFFNSDKPTKIQQPCGTAPGYNDDRAVLRFI